MSVTLKPGTLLVLTWGVYSDHAVHGPFMVLKPFDTDEAAAAYVAHEKAENDEADGPFLGNDAFRDWLAAQGYIADYPHASWDLGDSYTFEPGKVGGQMDPVGGGEALVAMFRLEGHGL